MIEQGCERISLEHHRPWRWWLIIVEQTERGPFVFARGGRAPSDGGCQAALLAAFAEAEQERVEFLRFRPTHALGDRGQLIPLEHDPRPVVEGLRDALGSGS